MFGGVTTERTATNDCDVRQRRSEHASGSASRPAVPDALQGSLAATRCPTTCSSADRCRPCRAPSIAGELHLQQRVRGRRRSRGANSRTVNLVEPNDDVPATTRRSSTAWPRGRSGSADKRLQAYMDVFNLLNASTRGLGQHDVHATAPPTNRGSEPLVVMQARRLPVRRAVRLLEVRDAADRRTRDADSADGSVSSSPSSVRSCSL